MEPTPSPLQRALEALRGGNKSEAEAIVTNAVKEASTQHGAQSQEYAAAELDLARILVAIGALDRAAEALRRAADVPAKEEQARRARLEYLTNLGEVLTRMGRFDEAQKAHEESLTGREELYGRGTDGYALGEAPLAELLLVRGQIEDAERRVETALAALWKAGRPQAIPVAALRAAIRAARYGDERPLLEPFKALSAPLQVELARACLTRASRDKPDISLLVLDELRERLEDEGTHEALLPHVVAAISNVASLSGAHEARISSLEWLKQHFIDQGNALQALEATLGVALAKEASEDIEGAHQTFQEAAQRAEEIGPEAKSRALRGHSIFLARRGRKEEAHTLIKEAVEAAKASGKDDVLGSALVAQGVLAQHDSRPEEAKPILKEALTLLPASHPDALYAQSHLDAADKGQPCGCGDKRVTLSRALEMLVRPHIPEGLLTSISVGSLEKLNFNVVLSRKPTPEEQQLLTRVIGQAVALLRRQIQARNAAEKENPEKGKEA